MLFWSPVLLKINSFPGNRVKNTPPSLEMCAKFSLFIHLLCRFIGFQPLTHVTMLGICMMVLMYELWQTTRQKATQSEKIDDFLEFYKILYLIS